MINWIELENVSFLPHQQIFILIQKDFDKNLYKTKFSNRCLTEREGNFLKMLISYRSREIPPDCILTPTLSEETYESFLLSIIFKNVWALLIFL